MKNIIAALIIAAGMVGAAYEMPASQGTTTATIAPAASMTHSQLTWFQHRPCKNEDSVNCYWDAGHAGNHKGHSFIVREMPGSKHMVCVMYIKRADARKWDYCS